MSIPVTSLTAYKVTFITHKFFGVFRCKNVSHYVSIIYLHKKRLNHFQNILIFLTVTNQKIEKSKREHYAHNHFFHLFSILKSKNQKITQENLV